MRKSPEISISTLFAILYGLAILNGYFFNWINDAFFQYKFEYEDISRSSTFKFALIVVIAPFLETYLFQELPNIFLNKLRVKNRIILILLPSLIFGFSHFYFWVYAVMAFFGGILINALYIYSKERSKYYFFIVSGFHSLYNLYGYIIVN